MYIAELSCNHNGSFKTCEQMVRLAYRSGADTVKMQLFTPDQMTLRRYRDEFLIKDGLWKGRYLWDLYDECRTPKEWLPPIRDLCNELGLNLMVSVFHPDMVNYCEEKDVKLYKIASPEIAYDDLIDELAFTEKPVFASTGLASKADIDSIVSRITNLTLLHCVSQYPASLESCNLLTILDLAKYSKPVGLSDHTTSLITPVVATTLGAVVIEKHFKIIEECLDGEFSMNPGQFFAMVQACEAAKSSLGAIRYAEDGPYKRRDYEGHFVRTVR